MKPKQTFSENLREHTSTKPVQRRLLVPLVIVLLLLVGGFSFVLMRSYKTNLDQTSARVLKGASDELAKEMVEQSEGLAALEEVFLRDASLHYAMKDRDRERLLTSYGDVFAQLRQDHGMTHFYFHGPDWVNLLRVHKPEKHGDLIDRFTAREAERTGKMASGIELGPLGTFTLRVVRPVFDGGTLIGYIELGKEIEDILAGIHDKHGVELAIDIRKSLLDRTKWEAGMKMLGREADWDRFPDDVLIYTSMPRFPTECEQYVGEAGLTYDDVTAEAEFNGKSWRVMANPLKDASGAGVGDLIVMDDISEAKSAFNRLVAVAIGVALLLVTALIGFLYVVLRHTDQGIYKQQEALRESEEKYRTILESIEDGYFEVDLSGNLTFFNDSMCKIFGYSKDELIGMNNRQYTDEVYAKEIYQTFNKVYTTGKPNKSFHWPVIRKDGTKRTVAASVSLRRDTEGEPMGFRGIVRDISERKRFEAQLQQVTKMEAIATLAGGVAHEFNNTLMGIMGNIELLKINFSDDGGIDKQLESMKGAGHRMSRLTAQLLAYAEGGKYQPKDLKLDDFVIETLPILQHNLNPTVSVETVFPKDISHIEADHAQMQMVLSAILANSNEAIEDEGIIRITAENKDLDEDFTKQHPGLEPGYYVCLTIEDNGKGMDEKTKSGIFEPFFTTKFQGRGMGMAAVYGIIMNHDGGISVDSELGKGTVVQIYLPAIEIEVEKQRKAKADVTTGSGTILMIEDEDVVIEVTQAMLEMLGYRVMVAKTGKDAIHIAETFDGQIDLALLDIKLPDINGRNLYPLIMKARSNLKVIVCSGYSIDGPAREILDEGAQDFIQKPFSIATLSEKLKEVLEGK